MAECLSNCLYFSVSRLNRIVTKMAEEEFRSTGLTPSYAFLILLVIGKPGISPGELGSELHVAPSTVTRLLDKLEYKGLVLRKTEGKTASVHPTDSSLHLEAEIRRVWRNLYIRYSELLGEEEGKRLTHMLNEAAHKL
jgi:DNA-binding MarR family transcriptional regulator